MGSIKISYAEAKSQFPDHVKAVLAQIKPGTKAAAKKPDELKWTINWITRIEPGKANQHFSSLRATCHSSWYAKFDDLPKQVNDLLAKAAAETAAEKKRIQALTPAQRNAETQAILAQLRGSPGFVEVTITNNQARNYGR